MPVFCYLSAPPCPTVVAYVNPSSSSLPPSSSIPRSPEGSSEPTPVTTGFFSTHTGAYEDELQLNDPLNMTMSAQLVCPPGYWCRGGKRFHCPAGTFGWTFGLIDDACSGFCKRKHDTTDG